MKVLYISKNIPLPNYKENGIVLEQAKLMSDCVCDFYYPSELLPKFLSNKNPRLKASMEQEDFFLVRNVKVKKIKYIRLFGFVWFEWVLAYFFKPNLRKNFDLIHAHMVFPDGVIASKLAKKYSIPFVITPRQGDIINARKNMINKIIFRSVINKAKHVICLTPSLEREINKLALPKKVSHIPNFIDNDFYDADAVSCNARVSNNINICVVANLIARKNVEWVVEFHKMNHHSCSLTICGDGKRLEFLKELAHESAIFTGRIEREGIIKELDKSDVFVLPSDNETFGLVYAEAAARGNIIVGKADTGLSGICLDGFYFPENKGKFFEVLNSLINLNPNEIRSMKSTVKKYSSVFKRTEVKNKLMKAYKSALT